MAKENGRHPARSGQVYLVGAGPGEAGLLTVRARELIETCDCLVYDYLASPVIQDWVRPGCEQVYVGKRPNLHSIPQAEIINILVEAARQGKAVVRLKGGDPFIFGRGGEEAVSLHEAGIPFEVVPGVTAALAAAAYAGIPLTHRDLSSSLTFLTGHENQDKHAFRVDFEAFARAGGTLCVYMGMGQIERICQQLGNGGLDPRTPATVVQWASLPHQRTLHTNLADLPGAVAEAGMHSPSVVFFGEVCRLHGQVGWFEQQSPLRGKRVVVTRSRERAGTLSRRLSELGADVLELPLIETRPASDPERVQYVMDNLGMYHWMVFTSANGVREFFNLFFERFKDIRLLGPKRIACVGQTTARELAGHRIEADLVPEKATAEALAAALLGDGDLENETVLVVTGNRNSDKLPRRLERDGHAIVDTLQVYETILTDLSGNGTAEDFRQNGADAITFTSSSTVQSFARQAKVLQLNDGARQPRAFSIGPQTSQAMEKVGLPCAAEAREHNLDGLIDVLVENIE